MAVADDIAAAAGLQLDVRSAHGPDFTWTPDTDAPDAAPSPVAAFLGRLFKPTITVRSAFGTVHKAPYGEPDGTTWPLLGIVLGVFALGVGGLAVAGLFAIVRRR